MKAHFTVYKALKEKNRAIQIGFTHQYLKFEPANFIPAQLSQLLDQQLKTMKKL
jgi:hypothetical protein